MTSLTCLTLNQVKGRVLLHAPDGLKTLYPCLAQVLEKSGFEVYFSSNPGYGACDIPIEEAESIQAQFVVHVGHSKYYVDSDLDSRVVYVPAYYRGDLNPELVDKLCTELNLLNSKFVSVSSTLIEKYIRDSLASRLQEAGFNVRVVEEPVLGCAYGNLKVLDEVVDAHIIVSGGIFHPLGLALAVQKPVIAVDPYLKKIWNARSEADKVIKARLYAVFRAKIARRGVIGLIAGSRLGQVRSKLYEYLEKLALSKGYRVFKITSNYLTLERLVAIDAGLDLDFYVVTSCPRLPIDDLSDFHKPVLTPGEFLMLVRGLDRYRFPW